MSSTDDPRGEEDRGEEPIDESVLPPGPRRSTYTPPVPQQPVAPTRPDDAMADVIAANLASATDAANVIYQLDDIAPSMPMDATIEQLAAPEPNARIMPKDMPAADDGGQDAAAAAPTTPPAEQVAAMPSPTASAVPADLPPPEFDVPSVTFGESVRPEPVSEPEPFEFGAIPVEPEPAVTFDLDADLPEPAVAPEPAAASEPDVFEPVAFEPEAWEPQPWEPEAPDEFGVSEETTSREPEPHANPDTDSFGFVEETTTRVVEHEVFELPVALPDVPAEPFDQAAFLAASAAPSGQRPWIPERQSLRDDELAALIESGAEHPGGTLGMMEELERQVQLREEEKQEFTDWQESMLAVGTPEALAAVNDVLPAFQDLVPPVTSAIPVQTPVAPVVIAPPPAFTAPVSAPPPVFDAPPPAFDAPVSDAPPPTFDALASDPPQAVAAEPQEPVESVDGATLDGAIPEEPAIEEPSVNERNFDERNFDGLDFDERDFDVPPTVFDAPPPPFAAPVSDAPPPVFDTPVSDAPAPDFDTADAESPAEGFDDLVSPIDEIPAFATPAASVDAPALGEPPTMPDAWDIPEGHAYADSEVDPIFIEPVPVESGANPQPLVEPAPFGGEPFVDRVFTGPVAVVTGSVPIAPQQFDVDGDDPVDETDQVPESFDDLLGPAHGTAPIEPILSPRIPEDEVVLGEAQKLERPRVFSLEAAGLEPTPTEQRVGRASRMFWMWFAANSSIVGIAFGAVLFSLGLSLRQAIVGILAGVAVSFLPLGLATFASKRSGQPTMVVSRAAFGVVGNSVPAFVAFVSRIFWGAAMLWLLARAVSEILVGAEATGGLDASVLTFIVLGGAFAIALVVALFGYGLLAKFQLVVSIISGILVIGVIALTFEYVDVSVALTNPDGSWLLAGTVAVLVFSFVGLLWAQSAGDLARYQRPDASVAGSMLWTTFGAAVPTFLLISYGALLAASNEQIADGLLTVPFDTIGRLLPVWYPVPLIAAVSLSLLSGVIVSMYSGGFALKAVGLSLSRPIAAIVTAVLVAGVAFALTQPNADLIMLFRDLATTIAVPVAAWVGIFSADAMIRNRRYHADSLLRSGGIYPTVNWVNLPAFVVITAIGFGLTTATIAGLSWQGFLWPLLGFDLDSAWAGTDLGVFAALLLGLLVPIVSGVPRIRRQESATPVQN